MVVLLHLQALAVDERQLPAFEVVGRIPSDRVFDESAPVAIIEETDLTGNLMRSLDRVLEEVPGFSLFRRSSSLSAHPTTQGASLRNLGPNGAGRALVLLDGIPQNDPFGGWVNWAGLPRLALEQAAIQKGASAGQYGHQALTGVVRLNTRSLTASNDEGAPFGILEGGLGRFDTWSGGLFYEMPLEKKGGFQLSARRHTTSGFYQVPADQRGSIDRPMALEGDQIRIKGGWKWNEALSVAGGATAFDEFRQNGTPEAHNRTRGKDLSLVFRGTPEGAVSRWEWMSYYQRRNFRNQFTAIEDSRDSERPVLEQFKVPSRGWGSSLLLQGDGNAGGQWTLGGDVRLMKGATHEQFRNLGNGYTRRRIAGGEQQLTGLFVQWRQDWGERVLLEVGTRFDRWEMREGHRNELDLENDSQLLQQNFEDRNGEELSGRFDLQFQLKNRMRGYVAGYRGFRLPTLNEYYRPFRVGNDITEANPTLGTESLYGIEAGVSGNGGFMSASYRAGLYYNFLRDGVTNVTLFETDSGQGSPLCGFVPAGGSCRQRQNVDGIKAYGMEIELKWDTMDAGKWTLRYLYTHARFSDAGDRLQSKRPAQSPEHAVTLSGRFRFLENWTFEPDLTLESSVYEDDLNRRKLAGFVRLDTRITYRIREGWTVFGSAENITNEAIQTAVRGNGLLTLDAPFRWGAGVRIEW